MDETNEEAAAVRSRCGYCGRGLVEQPEVQPGWSCPRCAPLLVKVMDVDQWRAFAAEALKDWQGDDPPD
jgi:DNA-directed RNA polymerase subunit RPC12/RpoP